MKVYVLQGIIDGSYIVTIGVFDKRSKAVKQRENLHLYTKNHEDINFECYIIKREMNIIDPSEFLDSHVDTYRKFTRDYKLNNILNV